METEAAQIFKAMEAVKVLIIGDVMVDRYLTGEVSRISPEAPVPIVHLNQRENRLGGAANVALNIKAMGATPYLCSVIGKDAHGEIFMNLLPEEGLWGAGMVLSEERLTTSKTRVIADSQHLLRVDSEDLHPLSDKESLELIKKVISILDQETIDVILFQDYNKGVLTETLIQTIVAESKNRAIPTVVDPKKDNFLAYKGVQLFKPNLREVQEALPFRVSSEADSLQNASKYLQDQLGNQYTLITLSEKGLFIDDRDNSSIIPTSPRQIADVCGAGDTVISVVAVGLATGLDIRQIAILANLAGGQVCEKVGVVPVNKKQLEKEYMEYHLMEIQSGEA